MKKGIILSCITAIAKRCYTTTAALLTAALLTIPTQPSHAIEELKYTPANVTGPSFQLQLDNFLKENFNSNSSDYMIANTDLNGDNLLEHILKRNNCGQYTNICTHLVIAKTEDKVTLLSKINAHRLMVGDSEKYDIKNLLAFKNKTNAYNFDIYIWSPREKMYILEPRNKRD